MSADGPVARPVIGVLGGMGPEATVDLMGRVVRRTRAADDADHVRLLVDQNPQVPSRIKALIEKTGPDPVPVLLEMARGLAARDVAALAMPCNTAHHYLPQLAGRVDAPFLDMVELTAARLATAQYKTVGLLASTAVRMVGLYERALGRRGLTGLFPPSQEAVMEVIRAVKAGRIGKVQEDLIAEACHEMADEGADVICIACTEISVLADAIPEELAAVDAMDVLADEIIRIGTRPA